MDIIKLFGADIGEQFSIDEVRQLIHVKRFFECMRGDAKFRNAFHGEPAKRKDLFYSRGIFGLDPEQVALLAPSETPESEACEIDFDRCPQIQLWNRFKEAERAARNKWIEKVGKSSDKHYNAWRERQLKRVRSELGANISLSLGIPLVAFELSQGCSMGCPFCAVASRQLQGNFLYTPDNVKLWRNILKVFADRFGAAVAAGFCYWATEPTDNPDYLKFVADFADIVGALPQTTTAAPLRNLEWTRALMELRQGRASYVDRFSVLSAGMLRRVHETFTAEDLALVELNCMGTNSLQPKTRSGRQLGKKIHKQDIIGTCACVSGYLVNMVEGSIKLISPCCASTRWPLGYRVYAEGHFSSAMDVENFISDSIREYMQDKASMDKVLAFRHDLEYIPVKDGFNLRSAHTLHKMNGAPHMSELGRQINQSAITLKNILANLMEQYSDIFSIAASIQILYENGLLADECDLAMSIIDDANLPKDGEKAIRPFVVH